MKILACLDDFEYSELLAEQLEAEDPAVHLTQCHTLAEVTEILQHSVEEESLVLLDAFSGAQELVARFPDKFIILTSPRYDRALEIKAHEIGAAGYFPRVQDADVVAYIVEQIKQISLLASHIH